MNCGNPKCKSCNSYLRGLVFNRTELNIIMAALVAQAGVAREEFPAIAMGSIEVARYLADAMEVADENKEGASCDATLH